VILLLAYDVRRSGGIERLTLQVLAALRAGGHRVRLLEPRQLGSGGLGRWLGRGWFLLQLVWWLPQAKQVLSMHALLLKPLRVWDRLPLRRRHRRLCWLHGIEVWGRALDGVAVDLSRCEGLAASSCFTADQVRRSLPEAPPIQVVHPCADLRLEAEPEPFPPSLRLLTVARMAAAERYKGHDQILDALALLRERGELAPGFRWRVVGCGDDQLRLQQRAAALGLEAWIDWLGRLNDEDLAEDYRRCSLVVMPSGFALLPDGSAQGEGFGITYLEAALAGRPAIGALVGGQCDLIRHGETGWLVGATAHELAAVLRQIQRDPMALENRGLQARSRALTQFSRSVQQARLLNWLAKL
jgi:glycosyltransferase involved in cell wall biosynthesis